MRRAAPASATVPLYLLAAACSDQPQEGSKVAPPYVTSAPSVWIGPSATASAAPEASATSAPLPLATGSAALVGGAKTTLADQALLAPEFLADIERRGVTSSRVARRTLYSWTSFAQAEAIAKGGPVLVREESAKYGPSGFDWMLDDAVEKNDPLAKLLFHKGFAKKRFAWPNAFATALGFQGESYGSALLAIELSAQAVIVDLTNGSAVSVDGKAVSLEDIQAHPERIAAAYWIANPPSPGVAALGPPFREYVLLNESMIEKVTVGGPALEKLFDEERELVAKIARRVALLPEAQRDPTLAAYATLLAFSMAPQEAELQGTVAALGPVKIAKTSGERTIKASFALGAARARLKVACKTTMTRGFSYMSRSCTPAVKCELLRGTCMGSRRTTSFLDL